MTLVVAAFHADLVYFVGDTKITDDDDEIRTANLFAEARVKILLLRDGLAVAVAGCYAEQTIEEIMRLRHAPVDVVLNAVERIPRGDFLVAALDPARLWKVRGHDGVREEVPPETIVGIGDENAVEHVRQEFVHRAGTKAPLDTLRGIMGQVILDGDYPGVGGYPTTATSVSGVFRYALDGFAVAPRSEAELAVDDQGIPILLITAPGSSGDWYHGVVMPGGDPTPFAIGVHISEAGIGLLFRQERFHRPEVIRDVPTPDDLIREAAAQFAHTLRLT